jgi:hypothetical protein
MRGPFERPYNIRMEPTRQTFGCDPGTVARGSFGPLGSLKYQSGWSTFRPYVPA